MSRPRIDERGFIELRQVRYYWGCVEVEGGIADSVVGSRKRVVGRPRLD
jgi:hypothetical protein